jgi:Ser/Thr protein kinase RdoA (MazF antagonist)
VTRRGGSEVAPELMAHGYTHRVTRLGGVVTKNYRGPEAAARCAREVAALTAMAGLLPVPPVLAAGDTWLRTGLMPGAHGQDLIAAGLAGPVLAACGTMLRRIHRLAVPAALAGTASQAATFLVHGDFGPNNVLLDDRGQAVTAVLDWEWAHAGDPIDDVAWTEFIVRMHHPAQTPALDGFYAAYGSRPAWPAVRAAILRRCQWLLELCQRAEPGGPGVLAWTERIEIVRSWPE